MIAASFYTLTYWTAFGGVCVVVLYKTVAEIDRRKQERLRRERRLRRQIRDARAPQRWTP